MIRILVDLAFVGILYCLGSAFFQLVRTKHNPEKVAKSLAWRSGISILLVLFLLLAYKLGWIHPHTL